MALVSVPRDRNPEFFAACISQIPPGGATVYADPEPMGSSPSDMTDFIWGQQAWSETNLPDIMYVLEPSPEWNAYVGSARPPPKIGTDGQPVLERYPKADKHGVVRAQKLLDFKILPDQISTKAPWWKLEAWRRLDPRVRWCDILMRMELGGRPSRNALNTECFRWRGKFTMLSWHDTPTPGAAGITADVLRSLTAAQRATNSTRGSTPGLIDPSVGEQGGRIPLPNPPRPVRRAGVPTANGNNVIRQNNLTLLATGPPQAGSIGSGYNPTALATRAGMPQAGNLGFRHSNGPGVYDMIHQSRRIPQDMTYRGVLGSSVMIGPSGRMNTYGAPTPMPSRSSYQLPHRSSLAQHSQHNVSMDMGQQAAINTLRNDSASANYIDGGVISPTTSPFPNESVLRVPASFQPFNECNSHDQECQCTLSSYPILPGVPKRSQDSVELDVRDPITFKRPRLVQNSSSDVLDTPWTSTTRMEPEVRHNGPTAQSYGGVSSRIFAPGLIRSVQKYTSNSAFYQRHPGQTLSSVTDPEGQSELSGFSRVWDPTTKRHSHARAPHSSTYLSLPTQGHENIHEQHNFNASPDPSFSDILNPTDAAQPFGLGLAFDYPRSSPNTWTPRRSSRANFRGTRNSTSDRIGCTEDDQQPAVHQQTDRAALNAATCAWLAADGGWDEFPIGWCLKHCKSATKLSAPGITEARAISQHKEPHSQLDTTFTNSSTREGIPNSATEVASPQPHQSQHGTANVDGLDYLFDDADENDI